jgi:hypothetical protein
MDLARKTGAGVGVANGWFDYTGLYLPPPRRAQQIWKDIASLLRATRPMFPFNQAVGKERTFCPPPAVSPPRRCRPLILRRHDPVRKTDVLRRPSLLPK